MIQRCIVTVVAQDTIKLLLILKFLLSQCCSYSDDNMSVHKLFFYLLVSFIDEYSCCWGESAEMPTALFHSIPSPGTVFLGLNKWMRYRDFNDDCQVNGVYDCDCEYNKFYCNYENLISEEGSKPHWGHIVIHGFYLTRIATSLSQCLLLVLTLCWATALAGGI